MGKLGVSHSYRRTQILTANPSELMLILYNACICFCQQAKTSMAQGDYEGSHCLLVKAENIVMELSAGLRRDVFAELVDNLSRLFEFVFYRLFEANTSHNPRCVDEAVNVLTVLRDAWVEAVEKDARHSERPRPSDEAGSIELSA